MTQPKQSHMPTNFVEKVSHDSLMPDFLKKLEEKLTVRRAPVLWVGLVVAVFYHPTD